MGALVEMVDMTTAAVAIIPDSNRFFFWQKSYSSPI